MCSDSSFWQQEVRNGARKVWPSKARSQFYLFYLYYVYFQLWTYALTHCRYFLLECSFLFGIIQFFECFIILSVCMYISCLYKVMAFNNLMVWWYLTENGAEWDSTKNQRSVWVKWTTVEETDQVSVPQNAGKNCKISFTTLLKDKPIFVLLGLSLLLNLRSTEYTNCYIEYLALKLVTS